ncbi:MAG: hypothetical protein AABX89_07400 [Candidatus Thermoplasmatota archaeon]
MKTHIALALLLLAPLVAAGPAPKDIANPGSGWAGFEPDPPAVVPPNPTLADAELGCVLKMAVSGLAPAQSMVVNFAKNPLLIAMGSAGKLNATIVGPGTVRSLNLPPLDATAGGTDGLYDFTVFLTPVTMTIQRAGTQPSLDPATSFNPRDVVTATLNVWGAVQSTLEVAPEAGKLFQNPASIQKPPTTSIAAERFCVTDALAPVTKLMAIDPDDNLVLGTLTSATTQVPTTDTLATTASGIKSMLDAKTLTDLDLNHLLGALSTATKAIGSLDTTALGANMATLGYATRTVTLPNPDPKTILDTANKQLILVDGGFGKIVLLSDPVSMVADNNLITALKSASSTNPTHFSYLSQLDATRQVAGGIRFDSTLGNYRENLAKFDELAKTGIDTSIVPTPAVCKNNLNAATKNAMCFTPGALEVTPKMASVVRNLGDAGKFKNLLGTTSPLGSFNGVLKGTDTGLLKDLPPIPHDGTKLGGVVGFGPTLPSFGKWKLPSEGIGAIPGIDGPNPSALKDVGCKGSCLPDHDLNVLDGIYEGMQAPAMPNAATIIPMGASQGVVAALTNAVGTAIATVPLSVLQQAPIGAMSQLTIRAVGGSSTGYLSQGLKEVAVQVDSSDLFGISKTSSTSTTNTNGYATLPISALSQYTVTLTKQGYQPATGTGQAPAPGGKAGQEYTMESGTGNNALDWFNNNKAESIVGLLTLALVAYLVIQRVQDKRKDPTRQAKRTQGRLDRAQRRSQPRRRGAP